MAPYAPRVMPVPASSRQRSESHSHSHLATAQNPVARSDTAEKQMISTRSDSVGTSGSTPHTDSTEYPWSASTGMTSAAMTPSRSKRASSQAISTGPETGIQPKQKTDATNAEWMRLELEKHFRMHEKVRGKEHGEPVLCSATYIPSGSSPRYSRDFSHVPARKPVPSRNTSVQPSHASRPATGHDPRARSSPTRRGRTETVDHEDRGRSPPRSYSRIGRASRAASRAASVAATRAGSIANEILVHLDRRHVQPVDASSGARHSPSKTTSRAFSRGPTRPPSRVRSISRHVKEYFRPGSGNSARQGSTISGRSNPASCEESSEKGRGWRLSNRGHSTVDMSRPFSAAHRALTVEPASPESEKLAVDLNRELPPLPGLDKWEDPQAGPASSSDLTRTFSKMEVDTEPYGTRNAGRPSRSQLPPGSMVNSASPRTSVFKPHLSTWRPTKSEPLTRNFNENVLEQGIRSGISREQRHQPMRPSQRVSRPQNRGPAPPSSRNGFVNVDAAVSSPSFAPSAHRRDPDSTTMNSGHTHESYFRSYRDQLQTLTRQHQRSPTLNDKVRRKWWPSNLKRSPSQAGRMDSVVRPVNEIPMA